MNHPTAPHDPEPCRGLWRTRFGVGWLVLGAWPTLLTLTMFPVLLLMYRRLAITEEQEMHKLSGEQYDAYAQSTPRFVPRLGQARSTAGSASKR